jgi:anti-sigma regulatory factor (Ser/Thr protein kinase)
VAAFSEGLSGPAAAPPTDGCGLLAAEYDWSKSDFGPRDRWEPAVEAVVRTLIEATAPMAYLHGRGYAMAYNDRFADLLGARHPRSWGQHADLAVPEIWSRRGYAEAVDNIFAGGRAFHDQGENLDLRGRHQKHPEWAYLARSYSPVRDSDGSVLGILVVVVEIAPVLVLVGGGEHDDQGAASWRGIELWDETVARRPLIWSGFRAGARSPEAGVAESDQRFIEGQGQSILPINGPDIRGTIGYLGMRRHLPDVQMVTLAARDPNLTTETGAGGEFYDVFSLPDGRLAITIGDVMGVGVAASAVMAQVKMGLRGAALTSSDPNAIFTELDEVVSRLDRTRPVAHGRELGREQGRELGNGRGLEGGAMQSRKQGPEVSVSAGFGGELLVTALFGIFDPATGELLLASAGNPPPAIVRRREAVGAADREGSVESERAADFGPAADSELRARPRRLVEFAGVEPGPPLGVSGDRPVLHLVLEEGDALVAFTEGLIERQEQSLAQGQTRLLRTLGTMSSTAPRSISQHVVDELIGGQGLEHDCALLVVVRDNRVHQTASMLVPPHAIAVRGARRWVRDQLQSWGLDEGVVDDAVMSVSELVTNVGLHAGTTARVTMELADRLLVTIEDTGTWGSPRPGPEDHSASQGRGLALVAAISDAMGHARGAEGSTVWFELALDRKGR